MESPSLLLLSSAILPLSPLHYSLRSNPLLPSFSHQPRLLSTRLAAVKTPRGFGPPPPPKKKSTRKQNQNPEEDDGDGDENDEYDRDATIPEVVTNRMMRRMGLSVGIPLFTGLMFFPFFYYLKVVAKVDVPNWVPFLVSFVFFGAALLGVSYGIVSSSWDPVREGSLLGWNEARRNWPVFWNSLWGSNGRTTRR